MLRTLGNLAGKGGELLGLYSKEKAIMDHTEYTLVKSYMDNGNMAVELPLEPNTLYGRWPHELLTWGIRRDGVMYRVPAQSQNTLASNPLSVYLQAKIDAWNVAPPGTSLAEKREGIYAALKAKFAASERFNKRQAQAYKDQLARETIHSTTGAPGHGPAPGAARRAEPLFVQYCAFMFCFCAKEHRRKAAPV